MAQPAARMHDDVAHQRGAGLILEGAPTVRIGGQPAARMGDRVRHNKGIEPITEGEPSVRLAGRPAARVGDEVACHGVIAQGCPTVRIGRDKDEACMQAAADEGAAFVVPAHGS